MVSVDVPTIEGISVVEPQPNPETVEALLDTTWRVAQTEAARTDALDRKAATVATFASILATLTATLGVRFVEHFSAWWAVLMFSLGLLAFLGSVGSAIRALFPREYLTLGISYLERFPTWSEIRKSPTEVRGTTMRGVVEAVARERKGNHLKAETVRSSFALLLVGLVLIAAEAATLAVDEILS
jgi:hypothetical protein